MATLMTAALRDDIDHVEQKLYRRVAWRIMPIAVICLIFSHFDRINISFAKTQMQADLGLSDTAYGVAASIFFLGYVLFEVPSGIGLRKYGAPAWICRVMVTWGLATAALMFASNEWLLYGLRFLIGVMEAGFAPAIMVYLCMWFPRRKLAQINGLFFLAVPLAGALGAPVSGLILQAMDGVMGLAGWHWLFLITGLPCSIWGIVVLYRFDRTIEAATWLEDEEKKTLMANLQADLKPGKPVLSSMWKVLLTREVLLLALIYFTMKTAAYGINFWMPNLIAKSGAHTPLSTGLLSALPYAIACIAMLFVTRYSDRTGDRKTVLWVCMTAAAIGFLLSCFFFDNTLVLIIALMLTCMGTFIAVPVFWTVPQSVFSGMGLVTAIAAINSAGQISGLVAPILVGWLNDLSGTSYMGMLAIAPVCMLSVYLVISYVPSARTLVRATN